MEAQAFVILFYNTDRGVEFSLKFNTKKRYERALEILLEIGLIDELEIEGTTTDGRLMAVVDDSKYAIFSQRLEAGQSA